MGWETLYFQENMTSRVPFLLLRIRFPGRPIFIHTFASRPRQRRVPPDGKALLAAAAEGGAGGAQRQAADGSAGKFVTIKI